VNLYGHILFVVMSVGFIIIVMDYRITRAFALHELWEARKHADIQLLVDASVAATKVASIQFQQLREVSSDLSDRVDTLHVDLVDATRRLKAIEERIMRAGLAVPVLRRTPNDPPP
jgi:hypothetical protein